MDGCAGPSNSNVAMSDGMTVSVGLEPALRIARAVSAMASGLFKRSLPSRVVVLE